MKPNTTLKLLKVAAMAMALAVSGCSKDVLLLSSGNAYKGTITGSSMEIVVDEILYRGQIVDNTAVNFGGMMSNGRYINTHEVIQASAGRSLLIGSNNQTISCEFSMGGSAAVGSCKRSDGRIFELTTK
jgi:hypothetical protein